MSGNQAARHRMFGGVKQRFYIALFDNLTVRHHRHVIRQTRHNAHIMGDQQHSRRLFLHNAFQQIEDARLCYHVEVGGRFIGDDKR